MRGWRGFLTGALGLIVLEILVTSSQATGRVTGLFSGVAKGVDWLVSNTTPGLPDRTQAKTSSASSSPSSLIPAPAFGAPTPAYANAGSIPGSGGSIA